MRQAIQIRLLVIATSLATGACFKEYSENFQEEETTIENAAIGQQDADDALDMAYRAEVYQRLYPADTIILNGCARIYHDSTVHLLTINFGSKPCAGFLNRQLTGKILITYEGQLGDTLKDRTLTFESYVVNNRKVEGTVSLHNRFVNSAGLNEDDRTLTDLTITFPDGSGIKYEGTHTRVWTSGRGDTVEYNNIYNLFGSITGTTSSGRNFTQDIDIDHPVKLDFYCATSGDFARTRGIVELSKLDGYPDRQRTVDYGDSTCDKTISVKTFRRTYGVTTN